MNLGDAWQWLASFTNLEKTPSATMRTWRLDRMRELLAQRGHPEVHSPALHLAGSKGKGTTATYLSSLLTSLGHRTGLYTSPHVVDWRERITLNGWFFDDDVYLRTIEGLRDFWDSPGSTRERFEREWGGPPTTFEWLTLAAFEVFRDQSLTARVLETGLGGRLDATNTQTPTAVVLTLIELEHTDILGSTRTLIAGEKAGILKPNVPAFVAPQPFEALDVFKSTAQTIGAPLHEFAREVETFTTSLSREGTALHLRLRDGAEYDAQLPLLGKASALAAAVATWTIHTLLSEGHLAPPSGTLKEQIRDGLESTYLPGRMQVVRRDPWTILDGAHTEASVEALVQSWVPLWGTGGTLIFGAFEGKSTDAMARLLAPVFGTVILTSPGNFRPSNLPALRESFLKAGMPAENLQIVDDAVEADQRAQNRGKPILICGSFYLVGRFLADVFSD